MTTGRSLRALPKAHLHLHLEGSARPETMRELGARAGLAVRDYRSFSGWEDFLALYRHAVTSVLTLDDLTRLCRELVEDEAAQGVRYVEPHVNLFGSGYVPRFGPADEVWSAVREAFVSVAHATGVEVNVVVASIRDLPPALAEEAAMFGAEHAHDGIAAFGLAGSEHLVPAADFSRAAAIAREAGLLVVPHAGELCGPESVVDAVDELGASRIAHGVRAVEDREVLTRLGAEDVACDVCITSNVALGIVQAVDAHPLPQLIDAGVPVTLGADDSLMFGAGIADEYALAREVFELDDETLAAIARTSVTASGADAATKARLLAEIDDWLAAPPSDDAAPGHAAPGDSAQARA